MPLRVVEVCLELCCVMLMSRQVSVLELDPMGGATVLEPWLNVACIIQIIQTPVGPTHEVSVRH